MHICRFVAMATAVSLSLSGAALAQSSGAGAAPNSGSGCLKAHRRVSSAASTVRAWNGVPRAMPWSVRRGTASRRPGK